MLNKDINNDDINMRIALLAVAILHAICVTVSESFRKYFGLLYSLMFSAKCYVKIIDLYSVDKDKYNICHTGRISNHCLEKGVRLYFAQVDSCSSRLYLLGEKAILISNLHRYHSA